MNRWIVTGGLTALVTVGCATTQPPVTPEPVHVPIVIEEDLTPVYDLIELGEIKYLASMDPANTDTAQSLKEEADKTFTDAAILCSQYTTCPSSLVTKAFSRVVSEQIQRNQAMTTQPEYFEEEEPPVFLEESPVTKTLRQGDSLDNITTMNGPIREAVRHWLINKRNIFVESYINFLFVEEVINNHYEQAGFPLALAFGMGAQESNFKMQAYSRDGAAGMWQFMCQTANEFGLACKDRFDPDLATEANIKYLNKALENFDDDWLRAIASYNTGIRRSALQGSEDYWELEQKFRGFLARETKPYVRQIIGAMVLFDDIRNNTDKYNLENSLPEIDTSLVSVVLKNDSSLGELSACMGSPPWLIDWKQILRNVNPQYGTDSNKLIPAGNSVLIPSVALQGYESHCVESELWTLLEEERPRFKIHRIRTGDGYGKVADLYHRQCGMSRNRMISELRRINGWRDSQIPIGKNMTVPCSQ